MSPERSGMRAAVGYRTSDPELLAAWDGWQADLRTQNARVVAWKQAIDPDDKLTLHARHGSAPAYFSGGEPPHGWRRDQHGHIVPNKRLKAGKDAAAEMDRLRKSAPDDIPRRLSLPRFVVSGDRWYEPGAFKWKGAIYVYWGAQPDAGELDLKVWMELKLSELYAAREAYDAAHDHPLEAAA